MQTPTPPQQVLMTLKDEPMEKAVLQGLITMRRGIDDAMTRLDDHCFFWQDHQKLFQTICELYRSGKELSSLSVANALSNKYGQEMSTTLIQKAFLLDAQNIDPMPLSEMVDVLVNLSRRRRLGPLSSQLLSLSTMQERDLMEGIARVQREIELIMCGDIRQSFVALPELMEQAIQHARDNQSPATQHLGLQTGIPVIDAEGGLCEGLTIIGARPSHGKSAFALYLALQAMKAGKRVAFFSMEMSNLQLAQRLLSMESSLNPTAIARLPLIPYEMQQLEEARTRLLAMHAGNFNFDNTGENSFEHMLQTIRALKRNGGLDVVVVDYMQLMDVERQQRDENTARMLARASHQMQQMGRDEQIYFLCLSQLNRSQTGIPTRNQLRDSGGIDEAADNVILLYRGFMDHLKFYPSPYDQYPTDKTLLMLLDKNRNGATSAALIGFDPAHMEFDTQLMQKQEGRQMQMDFESHLP